jgi:hypothetical protein
LFFLMASGVIIVLSVPSLNHSLHSTRNGRTKVSPAQQSKVLEAKFVAICKLLKQ